MENAAYNIIQFYSIAVLFYQFKIKSELLATYYLSLFIYLYGLIWTVKISSFFVACKFQFFPILLLQSRAEIKCIKVL